MKASLKYVSSNGKTYNLNANSIKTRSANFHSWKWNTEGTKLQYGIKLANFSKTELAYDVYIVIPGPNNRARKLLNELHESFEYDIRNKTPGRVYFDDSYIDCYIISSKTEPFNYTNAENKISIFCAYPFWVREQHRTFMPQESQDEQLFLDYEYDYAYDYYYGSPGIAIWQLDFPFTSDFRLTVFGPAVDPRVNINGYPYQINETLQASEYLIVDSRYNTVTKYLANGQQVNIFDLRDKSNSVFEPIPGGNLTFNWSGAFGFDLTLFQERSEPAWMV